MGKLGVVSLHRLGVVSQVHHKFVGKLVGGDIFPSLGESLINTHGDILKEVEINNEKIDKSVV